MEITEEMIERGAVGLAGYTTTGQFGATEWPKGYANAQKASCRNRAKAVLKSVLNK